MRTAKGRHQITRRVLDDIQEMGEPLRALVRAFGLLDRVMQPYFAGFGISGSQWGMLRTLYRAEREGLADLRLTDLSRQLLIRPPSVTAAVARLQRMGMLVRDASPEDLRAKRIRLSAKGRRLVEKILAAHPQQISEVLSGLSQRDQMRLVRLLGRLSKHLETLAEKTEALPLAAAGD